MSVLSGCVLAMSAFALYYHYNQVNTNLGMEVPHHQPHSCILFAALSSYWQGNGWQSQSFLVVTALCGLFTAASLQSNCTHTRVDMQRSTL